MAIRPCLFATTALLALAGCGDKAETPKAASAPVGAALAATSDECVPLADGMYEMRDGRLLVSSTPPEMAANNPALWAQEIQTGLHGAGLDWLGIVIRDQVAVVTGTAPDADTARQGFASGKAAIEGHPRAGTASLLIVDGISIEEGEAGIGIPLAKLAGEIITAETCQSAFNDTMNGRVIQFGSANANISPVSYPLIDALGGVAMLCRAFPVEIATHTDTRGADDYNLRVSQERADALRTYLVGKGLAEDGLRAVGYGESQPIDSGSTAEAHARNRRTEFKVLPR